MARAYSHDLRVRVLDAVGAGLSRRAAAIRYRIGIATVIRWVAHAVLCFRSIEACRIGPKLVPHSD